MSRPESITGGCLCGAIRYTIKFPESSPWPPSDSFVCCCSMCRKHTGAVVPHMATFPTADIEPPLTHSPALQVYKSSERGMRLFCGRCGSSLGWQGLDKPEEIDLHLGTVDEEWLCGKMVSGGSDQIGGRGQGRDAVTREPGLGRELCGRGNAYWRENGIPGVTDAFE